MPDSVDLRFRDIDTLALDGLGEIFGVPCQNILERLSGFLAALHSKLQSGAVVLFVDQLPYGGHTRWEDEAGNTLEERSLPDGRSFEIVKNFPSEDDIRNALTGIANDVEYVERPDEGSWTVTYTKEK